MKYFNNNVIFLLHFEEFIHVNNILKNITRSSPFHSNTYSLPLTIAITHQGKPHQILPIIHDHASLHAPPYQINQKSHLWEKLSFTSHYNSATSHRARYNIIIKIINRTNVLIGIPTRLSFEGDEQLGSLALNIIIPRVEQNSNILVRDYESDLSL